MCYIFGLNCYVFCVFCCKFQFMVDSSVKMHNSAGMKIDKSLILALIEAAMTADYTAVRRRGGQIAKRMAEQGDLEGAKALQSLLRRRGVPLQVSGYAEALPRDAGSRLPLIEEGQWPTVPMMLDGDAEQTISQFIEDAQHIDLLTEKGVSARLGLLLYGLPGNRQDIAGGAYCCVVTPAVLRRAPRFPNFVKTRRDRQEHQRHF